MLGLQIYVPEAQTQTQTQVDPFIVDLRQFQLIEEDQSEDIEIPQHEPRITEVGLDDRIGGDDGRADLELLHMVADEFLTDRFVIGSEIPRLRALGISNREIKRRVALLRQRPSISQTELFYLILNPRITDPFKKAFARFFEDFLENSLEIGALKSKIRNPFYFIKHHRTKTAYLSRLRP